MMIRRAFQFQSLKLCRFSSSRTKRVFSSISTDPIWEGMSKQTRDLAQSITEENGPIQRRVALSRAITLMESKNRDHKKEADKLLTYLLAKRPKDEAPSLRIGFAGPPGTGKSTMIEAFGMYLLEHDPKLQLAAVCIDPASEISGGSILGDKTRMTELSRHDRAYVRPSSNAGVLGGLAAYTDDVVTTLSAAGYPMILLETVGLGQSEVEVAQSVDILILLLPPGGGDELQGVKKGIVELANIIAVTKADGNLLEAAKKTASDYRGALRVLQISGSNTENTFKPAVILTSSVAKNGLDDLWKSIQDYKAFLLENDRWGKVREKQSKYWMWKQFTRLMQDYMKADPELGDKAKYLESELLHGGLTPRVAAQELLQGVFGSLKKSVCKMVFSALNEIGDSIIAWADPDNAFGGYTKGWPLTNFAAAISIAIAYFLFVVIGSRVMEKRDPIDPYPIKFLYNVSQIMLCAYMTIEAILLAYRSGYSIIPCNPYSQENPPLARLLWLFYVSKVWDFWDTIFIVLGKKWRQLSFLHVYHHLTIFMFYWLNANVLYDSDIYLTIALNGFIHTVMYTYYFICMHTRDTTTGKSLPIWWKSYLTLLQLIQFVTMMSQGTYLFTTGCDQLSVPIAKVYVGYIFSLFLLFLQFYVQSYMKPKKKKTA